MRLVFLGPPGAGKGTQAKVISERFKIPHVSTGDILRESVKRDSEVGRQAKGYMDKGELVPDEIVTKIVAERLTEPDMSGGFILDGFPRTRNQAVSLDDKLKNMEIGVDYVIYFNTLEETSISRLTGRRVCRGCGANYHITNIKPKKEGICDICGSELYQRQDDTVETVKNRLKVYQRQTADLIDYYRSKNILVTVSGELNVEGVFGELTKFFTQQGRVK
jgi:adenylate kinase